MAEELKCSCGRKATYICDCGCLCCDEDPCEKGCGGSVRKIDVEGTAKMEEKRFPSENEDWCDHCGKNTRTVKLFNGQQLDALSVGKRNNTH